MSITGIDFVWGRLSSAEYRRLFWILTIPFFLITATGCSTSRWIPINEELDRDGSGINKEKGQTISDYELSDGTVTEYKGQVRLVAQDSLVFWQKEHVNGYAESGKWVAESWNTVPGPIYSLDAVKSLKVLEGDAGKTVLLVLGVVVGFAVVVGGIAAASMDLSWGNS